MDSLELLDGIMEDLESIWETLADFGCTDRFALIKRISYSVGHAEGFCDLLKKKLSALEGGEADEK